MLWVSLNDPDSTLIPPSSSTGSPNYVMPTASGPAKSADPGVNYISGTIGGNGEKRKINTDYVLPGTSRKRKGFFKV